MLALLVPGVNMGGGPDAAAPAGGPPFKTQQGTGN